MCQTEADRWTTHTPSCFGSLSPKEARWPDTGLLPWGPTAEKSKDHAALGSERPAGSQKVFFFFDWSSMWINCSLLLFLPTVGSFQFFGCVESSHETTVTMLYRNPLPGSQIGVSEPRWTKFKGLESPDDSEQCAVEYIAWMHNLYIHIPLACFCHVSHVWRSMHILRTLHPPHSNSHFS